MRYKHAAVVVGLALGLMAGSAQATTVAFPSAGANFDGANYSGFILPASYSDFLYMAGNDIYTTFAGTGLASVNDFSSNFTVLNFLSTIETFDVSINSISVGSFSIPGCGGCGTNQTFSFDSGIFPSIVGNGTYTLAFTVASTIAHGYGSVAFLDGGTSTLSDVSAVPLPASAPMFSAALLALGAAGYGAKRKKAAAAA